jgi:starch synthase
MAALERRGSPWRAVLIGDGPERPALEARVAAERLTRVAFTGSLPYAAMPAALAAADAGVAPFAPEAHAPLRHGFYWSPLKVFEYMASGLPVVAPSLPRLRAILGAGATSEPDATAPAEADAEAEAGASADAAGAAGVLYDGRDPGGLAAAIASLTDADRRRRLGAAARARAERHYSWAAHCRELETAIAAMRAAPPAPTGPRGRAAVP